MLADAQAMKHLILAAVLTAVPLAAQADPTYRSRCWHEQGVVACNSTLETEHSITRTICGFGATAACKSRVISKDPPPPPKPPSAEMSGAGVVIMRGMPDR